MCWCTPEFRTPCCGKTNCIPPARYLIGDQALNTALNWANTKIEQQAAQIEKLRGFAQDVMEGWPNGCEIDYSDIHSCAVKRGLLMLEARTERCGDWCFCAEEVGFSEPVECYRKTELLTGETK